MKHFSTLKDLSEKEILDLVNSSLRIKRYPRFYSKKMYMKNLLMIFEKPSLRTRVSLEVAMNQMGGNAINYDLTTSPLAKGKETIEDTAKVISRYCDLITARVYEHSTLEKLAANSSIPVINALSNFSHPMQIIGDLVTIKEKFGRLKGLNLAYFGDGNNNVTHSLLYACSKLGVNITVSCPKQLMPLNHVVKDAVKFSKRYNSKVLIEHDPSKVKNQDIVYTDSWMSYHIKKSEKGKRIKLLKKYQVNKKILGKALFMHCLPAQRGYEVTADVIDGKQSIVLDQAENRLCSAKAILLWCLK